MTTKILINAVDPEECRIAKIFENQLEEFQIEMTSREITKGNIYKGIVVRAEPSLQAVFVDYGANRHGFLQKHEIHSDYFQDNPSRENSIQHVIKPNQELLVQVTKDPVNKKGAMLTTFISLPGRHIVLMPGSKNRGISRKIDDDKERIRIKQMLEGITIPCDYGVIVRTASDKCTKAVLSKDMRSLMRIWKTIKKLGLKSKAPSILYKEPHASIRIIRDYFTEEVMEILVDNKTIYQELKESIELMSPRHKKLVKLYTGAEPIFTKYGLDEQIAYIYKNRVPLKSGGSIVIDQTEALVAIDVNSGKATKEGCVEDTAYKTNLEAAEIIAHQLRLRDLGGLIVIDFIDMKEDKHRVRIEKVLKDYVKLDKARVKIGKISKFGLLEMSRQRMNSSIEYRSYTKCPYCKGHGNIPTAETDALCTLRKIRMSISKKEFASVETIIPTQVASYLLNRKRKEIIEMEDRFNLTVTIIGDDNLIPGECKISCQKPATPINNEQNG